MGSAWLGVLQNTQREISDSKCQLMRTSSHMPRREEEGAMGSRPPSDRCVSGSRPNPFGSGHSGRKPSCGSRVQSEGFEALRLMLLRWWQVRQRTPPEPRRQRPQRPGLPHKDNRARVGEHASPKGRNKDHRKRCVRTCRCRSCVSDGRMLGTRSRSVPRAAHTQVRQLGQQPERRPDRCSLS